VPNFFDTELFVVPRFQHLDPHFRIKVIVYQLKPFVPFAELFVPGIDKKLPDSDQ
jgi:hypothetical protein